MKTITYNPETHVLVPVEPGLDITEPGWAAVAWKDIRSPSQLYLVWKAMLAAAPQPEPVDVGSVGWKHDCAALCANDIELWIDRCPHCGKPRHNHPPTDDELLNKAEQVESEPAMWVMKHIRSGDLAQAKLNQKALHPYMLSDAFPLYTTPQPDRTAELEAALKVARDDIDEFLVANDQTEFGCACDLSVGYLCWPCHADKQQHDRTEELELLRQRVTEKDEVIAEAGEMLAMRDRQLAALKTELREICAAIDDPACDLTLTAVECIKKLKAENEWQPIETAPKDEFVLLACPSGYTTIETIFTTGRMCSYYHAGRWIDHANDDLMDWGFNPTHWMPLPKPPAIKGEQ